ncbi:MAG: hypothetical protein UR28_C0018G0018 [Candidatus Peregrinibacteria bacterium GW2011_GWF2_33_10]|nr:MAG: hypothetical protein UR28_C0018G0018 [Candidatus Peregrinibacteria bacterium GW2011_GWF2_33_10]OGJ44701.1 MAG: hypothetical protein A2272_02390 [Candidatus Peregrinibacteria bacterium RIFOXYA12_FULL_33_12]OGJ46218.1 MAG: hypothetical protein A2263_05020 [Candidatus Peregrinibacteria bacterium RIFOXYA2_FULL_33_21]OGJ51634.1 MAG: hypothetical protein A2307_04190 [Candidatus Peregrinibacteria bacterium RIFOXYB2_FULL_33_20]
MKKILSSLFFLFTFFFSLHTTCAFTDVTYKDPQFNAVMYLSSPYYNLFDGAASTFRPNDSLNRAEFLAVMIRYYNFGSRELTMDQDQVKAIVDSRCNDVDWSEWYAKYIAFGLQNGMMNGYPDGSCKPANTINTAEAVKIISSTLDFGRGIDFASYEGTNWYDKYINAFNDHFVTGSGTVLTPDKTLTRAEFALILSQALQSFSLTSYEQIGSAVQNKTWANVAKTTQLTDASTDGMYNVYPIVYDANPDTGYYMNRVKKHSDGKNNYFILDTYNYNKRTLYLKLSDGKDLFSVSDTYQSQYNSFKDTYEKMMWRMNGRPFEIQNENFLYDSKSNTSYYGIFKLNKWDDYSANYDANQCFSEMNTFSYSFKDSKFKSLGTTTSAELSLCGIDFLNISAGKLLIEQNTGDKARTVTTYYIDLNNGNLSLLSDGQIEYYSVLDNPNFVIAVDYDGRLINLINLIDLKDIPIAYKTFDIEDFQKKYADGCSDLETLTWSAEKNEIYFDMTCTGKGMAGASVSTEYLVSFLYDYAKKALNIKKETQIE